MQKQRILIIGGGFGGFFCAKYLRKLCRNDANIEIEIISEVNYFVFQPLLPEVAAGTLNAQDAVTPLRNLLTGVKVRLASVQSIDSEAKQLVLIQGQKRLLQTLSYDHLVIATGQVTNLSMFPGFENHSLTMKNLSDAFQLRNHVIECLEVADITRFTDIKQRYLTFVVAGGGFSGVETIGELVEMIERILPQYPNIAREEIRAVLIQRDDKILPEMSGELGDYARKQLEKRGVEVLTETAIQSASRYAVHITDCNSKKTRNISARTIVTTIGNGPSNFVKNLPIELERGKIPVDSCLQVKGLNNIWSLGDSALVPVPCKKTGKITYAPPTAQFAAKQAKQLAININNAIHGKPLGHFCYRSKGMLASLGGYRGVAELHGVRVTGLLAWLIWRGIYIGMLPGFTTRLRVALNWFFDYFMPRTIVYMGESPRHATEYVYYSKGDCVHSANEIPKAFYIVLEGQLKQRLEQNGETVERLFNPGDSWGSRALKEARLTMGEVTALENCKLLVMQGDDFCRLRDAYEPLNQQLQSQDR